MSSSQPDMHYWYFFLTIEADLVATARYVEIARRNFATYSVEFARMLLSVCSEVEVVSKLLCEQIKPGRPVENIKEYRSVITTQFPKFSTQKVFVPRYGLTLQPWQAWRKQKRKQEQEQRQERSPSWWREYQEVKHGRHQHFEKANLKNALSSLAGLLCVELYLYGTGPNAKRDKVHPWARLLTIPKPPPGVIGLEGHYGLPDDPPTRR